MLFEKLSTNSFLLYAAKIYEADEDNAGTSEFNKDVKILAYVKKLLKKYQSGKDIKIRLLLNHIVILNNLFGNVGASRMLFFFCPPETFSDLKTLLIYLKYLPDNIPEVNLEYIALNNKLVSALHDL